MKFDNLGLPQDNGSSDLQDSARLAGIMTVFGFLSIDLNNYILRANTMIPLRDGGSTSFDKTIYVRHPKEYKYTFSRDQFVCLSAGLYTQGIYSEINTNYINGIDILSPAIKGHIARCKGLKANLLQDLWLWIDVAYHAWVKPLEEPNQLLCIMKVAAMSGKPQYLKWWAKNNNQWERSIRKYWYTEDGAWRNEPELAQCIIDNVIDEVY